MKSIYLWKSAIRYFKRKYDLLKILIQGQGYMKKKMKLNIVEYKKIMKSVCGYILHYTQLLYSSYFGK
jgi:hypothetical protein